MDKEALLSHYNKPDVVENIIAFSRGRWLALHCAERGSDGKPKMVRYEPSGGKPLKINNTEDFRRILLNCDAPRTFYASIHRYSLLERAEDVRDMGNILSTMPTWDIDPVGGCWEDVIRVAAGLVGVLEKLGVSRSVIVKWSGEGAHVHIHGEAFSEDVRRRFHPLDIAYAATEYVLHRVGDIPPGVKVENKIDPQRVFTCPLSLHRELDRVCVCINPSELSSFSVEWTSPENYRHYQGWREYVEGEADELAEKALQAIGPYPHHTRRRQRRRHPPLDQHITRTLQKLSGIAENDEEA